MSLINEALRKARKETGEKGGGQLSVSTSAHSSGRSRAGTNLVLGAVIAAIAAVGGAGTVWWLLADRQPPQNQTANTKTSDETDTAATSGETGLPVDEDETENVATIDSVKQPHEKVIELPTQVPQPAAEMPGESRPNPKPPAAAKRDFLAKADLGTTTLNLDYIVFRTTDSYAEINGIEVHVGNHIEGFVVEEILRDLVRLSDENGPLVLRVR